MVLQRGPRTAAVPSCFLLLRDAVEPTAEGEIRARIARHGEITFAEFMELALYHPRDGYYSRGPVVGARGDYYTSPAAHPAFGALVAIELRRMWQLLGRPSPFYAIEAGAGSGLLARDVTEYAPRLAGGFADALRYVALDRIPPPAGSGRSPRRYQRVLAHGVPLAGIVGCILSNELFDAFPVHRFEVHERSIKEVYVGAANSDFVERLGEPSSPQLARRLDRLGRDLPDGYRGEITLGIGPWMAAVAGALNRGFVLTVDYGYEEDELYSPARAMGTLQTYYRHTDGASPYRRVGSQDITAHVDFSALDYHGASLGLASLGTVTQARFLQGLGLEGWLQRLRTEDLGQQERDANMMGMRDLVRPDGLGRFRVLVQEKGTGIADPGLLLGLSDKSEADDLPLPLLRPDHIPLLAGRYPHTTWQLDELFSVPPEGEG